MVLDRVGHTHMATPKDKKILDMSMQPVETRHAPISKEVKEMQAYLDTLDPHELQLHISRGKAVVVTYPATEVRKDGGYDLVYISQLQYPTVAEQQLAMRDSASFYKSKKASVAPEEKKKIIPSVMQVPAIAADDWESTTKKKQEKLQEKADAMLKKIEENK